LDNCSGLMPELLVRLSGRARKQKTEQPGWVAQLVERGTHKPEVVGSKPTPATRKQRETRARSVARLTRLPVTEKIAGSNPVAPATKDISLRGVFCLTKILLRIILYQLTQTIRMRGQCA
jgi:hypothetical protein